MTDAVTHPDKGRELRQWEPPVQRPGCGQDTGGQEEGQSLVCFGQ